jgi:hypothetical protein
MHGFQGAAGTRAPILRLSDRSRSRRRARYRFSPFGEDRLSLIDLVFRVRDFADCWEESEIDNEHDDENESDRRASELVHGPDLPGLVS